MSSKRCVASIFVLVLCATIAASSSSPAALGETLVNPQELRKTEFITAEALKAKLAKNQPVTIIDVRATSGLSNSDSKIKGAIYVKLRRLKARLAYPPLRDIPRDGEIVTYCACPNDESSIHAAQVLLDAGYRRVRVLKGGWAGWKKANGQIESMATGI